MTKQICELDQGQLNNFRVVEFNIYWIFYLNYIFLTFWDAKLLIKFLYLSSSNICN